MELLDLTLDSAAANLALDEALLEAAEAGGGPAEALRLWESPEWVAVVGRSSRVEDEVRVDECRQRGIPLLRRCSGGASVLIGPGCLLYSVVLSCELRPALRLIEEAHRFVLDHTAAALGAIYPEAILRQGVSDLTLGDRKFSGNSLRCKRTHLLYHGTLLYDFALPLISLCLKSPPRQPEYRAGRAHAQFITNFPVAGAVLRKTLIAAWRPEQILGEWPRQLTSQLVRERYARDDWNLRR